MSNSELFLKEYKTFKIYDRQIEKKKNILLNVFNIFPKEDIFFEIDSDGITIFLRELDLLNFKKKIEIESKNTEDKDTINLLYSILEQIEKIKSYGLKGKKRLYVNYNKERKVKKKKIKEEKLIILMEIIFPKKQ